MTPEEIFEVVGHVPYMKLREARIFYDFIRRNSLIRCLELGFFHGTSSAYIAGALAEVEGGHLTTIDLDTARKRNPNIEELLSRTKLSHLVSVFYEEKSFNWRLMRFLQQGRTESFDFCFIDGGHNWDSTGLAFCVVQHLLAPGGWVVFDDLYYSFGKSSNRDKPWVKKLPIEQQSEQQVLRVFELLVERNPGFTNFRRMGGRYAFAQKIDPAASEHVLSPKLAIALSLAMERAHADPEWRDNLLSSPREVLHSLGVEFEERHPIVFEESGSFAPLPIRTQNDGTLIVPIELPSWVILGSRAYLERMIAR